MAVGQEQVEVPVVVDVEELEPPAAHEAGGLRDVVCVRDVRERLVPVVAVERVHLLVHVGHEEVLPAVLVEIGGIHAHAGAGLAVGAEADLGGQPDLLPLAVAAVGEEEVLYGVVGHEEVHAPVVVDVGGHHP